MKCVLWLAVLSSMIVGTPAPIHASCKIQWTFGVSCQTVGHKLIGQIFKWRGPDNCDKGGEKCFYSLTSNTTNEIKAKHATPKKHYLDDLTFNLSPSGPKCMVKGYSTSETWYAILDSGTNYCNLHNLITGSSLNETSGYTETTNNSICTQYSSADCEKY